MPTAIPFPVFLLKSSRAVLHPVARGPSSMLGASNLGHVAIANERKNGWDATTPSSPGYPVHCCGRSAIHRSAVYLKDGARELKTMRDRGASTIARDRASCDVNGMPGEAAALQVAAQIADQRTRIVRSRNECGTTS